MSPRNGTDHGPTGRAPGEPAPCAPLVQAATQLLPPDREEGWWTWALCDWAA